MFQLNTFTEALVTSVTNRVEKHGDDEKKAVTLGLEITAANTLLDLIDPQLRHALYRAKDDAEPELPEIERSTPVLRCNGFDMHKLTTSYEGWTLSVDDGIDETQPMVFGGAKVDKFVVEAKQGGSIVLRFRAGTSDVDAEKLGKLAMHNGESIWITLKAPEKKLGGTEATGAQIDGSAQAFKADHPDLFNGSEEGPTPEDALAHAVEGGDAGDGDPDDYNEEDDEGAAPDLETRLDAALDSADAARSSEGWPFPTGAADGSSDMERSARARAAAEQAELEAGMSESMAAAGVKPARRGRRATVGAVE